jgi:hypothetical protein
VFRRITQGLLNYPIEAERDLKGNLIGRTFTGKQDIEVPVLFKLGTLTAQGRNEPEVFQQRRVQAV